MLGQGEGGLSSGSEVLEIVKEGFGMMGGVFWACGRVVADWGVFLVGGGYGRWIRGLCGVGREGGVGRCFTMLSGG